MATTPQPIDSTTPATSAVALPALNNAPATTSPAPAKSKAVPAKRTRASVQKAVVPAAPAPKPAVKPPVARKAAVKKVAAKAVPLAAPKPAPSPVIAKPVIAKPVIKPLAKAAALPEAGKKTLPAKVKKDRLVRDSFTIPKTEFAVLEDLKQRSAVLGRPVKKSELLRAGIKLLASLSNDALLSALARVPTIKTGRPLLKS
ncbi:MAG: hypothetical protein JWR74_428 [Polaromonas sp.]|nr:hypothetical protein [Polaromonas sp.]